MIELAFEILINTPMRCNNIYYAIHGSTIGHFNRFGRFSSWCKQGSCGMKFSTESNGKASRFLLVEITMLCR